MRGKAGEPLEKNRGRPFSLEGFMGRSAAGFGRHFLLDASGSGNHALIREAKQPRGWDCKSQSARP